MRAYAVPVEYEAFWREPRCCVTATGDVGSASSRSPAAVTIVRCMAEIASLDRRIDVDFPLEGRGSLTPLAEQKESKGGRAAEGLSTRP